MSIGIITGYQGDKLMTIAAVFEVKWKDGIPDFKKTPVDLVSGGYSAMGQADHNSANPIECWIKTTETEIEELKSWIKFIRYMEET